jgi:hypothetical protein
MAGATEAGSETGRIELLLRRDGYDATRAWVERTLDIYRAATLPGRHGSDSSYRALFERSISEFEAWLATQPELAASHPAEGREDRGSASASRGQSAQT